MTEARHLNHSYVGTEHLLLGLLLEQKGIAAQVLQSLGLRVDTTREAILSLLGSEGGPARPAESSRRDHAPPATADRQTTITVVVEHGDGRLEAKKFASSQEAIRFIAQMET
jgi:ATP-dependent Clp protease ATP-binding subunit ClpA